MIFQAGFLSKTPKKLFVLLKTSEPWVWIIYDLKKLQFKFFIVLVFFLEFFFHFQILSDFQKMKLVQKCAFVISISLLCLVFYLKYDLSSRCFKTYSRMILELLNLYSHKFSLKQSYCPNFWLCYNESENRAKNWC